ncbi:hypothetical protein [Microcystis phage MaeS]|nr:hypothetical protein [Microcystis phage MaeS]
MKHIVFYSGGLGSWATAKRVVNRYGKDNVILMFTDTLIEDKDLYRFLIESVAEIFGQEVKDLIIKTNGIPPVSHETMEARREYLIRLAEETNKKFPQLAWIADGRDPWQVFKDKRWIGNSRRAQCSHILKQDMSAKFLKVHFPNPEDVVLYLGIDWTEEHRKAAPTRNWSPYKVEFPMCEEPLVYKLELESELAAIGIKLPELYKLGFSHNNCGGFCVRAGQGHFANLLKQKPELFKYHEEKEEEMRQFLEKDYSILTKQKNKIKYQLTLKQLREELQGGSCDIDMTDIGGCGCMVDDEDENYLESLAKRTEKDDLEDRK